MTIISKRKLFAVPVLALGLAIVLASCGEEQGSGAPEPGSAYALGIADSSFGEILVGADGNTLYAFTQDRDGESVCYEECAASWPALIREGGLSAGEGIDRSLLGTAVRSDGSRQVTYAGMPLYYFAGDAEPADTNGQGVGEAWFIVSPDGTIVEDSTGGGGYGYGS